MMKNYDVQGIAKGFGINFVKNREDIPIMGSPDRVEKRIVIEDIQGNCFLIEQIFAHKKNHRDTIAKIIQQLHHNNFHEVLPYVQNTTDQSFFVEKNQQLFQIQPFLFSDPLNRPQYVFDDWRGEVMATLLIELKKASQSIDFQHKLQSFSLIEYIDKLFLTMGHRHPSTAQKLKPVYQKLQDTLFVVSESLPKGFCHGDYHPNNILWKNQKAMALIDWEFVGIKTELYDVANMISCLGMEDPESLVSGIVKSFIQKLRQSECFSSKSFEILIDLVMAIRFGWLSEWLRKEDTEMLLLELDYFELLIEYRVQIQRLWLSL